MKKLLTILTVLAMSATILITPVLAVPPPTTDPRCNGQRGVQVWENPNKGGGTTIFCGGIGVSIRQPDLSTVTTGLGFLANWNNRISSYQTFNMSSTVGIRLYDYQDYVLNFTNPDRYYVTTMGNGYVSDLKAYWGSEIPLGMDDKTSSLKSIGF